jgi:hypothetical protein
MVQLSVADCTSSGDRRLALWGHMSV